MSETPTNGRVSLRTLIEARFDSLDKRLDEKFQTQDSTTDDHEDRIRSLEKRAPWRTAAEVVTGIIAVSGNFFGFRK